MKIKQYIFIALGLAFLTVSIINIKISRELSIQFASAQSSEEEDCSEEDDVLNVCLWDTERQWVDSHFCCPLGGWHNVDIMGFEYSCEVTTPSGCDGCDEPSGCFNGNWETSN